MVAKGIKLGPVNLLIIKEAIAPKIIFKLPTRAEALPALLVNGNKDNAVVLGF